MVGFDGIAGRFPRNQWSETLEWAVGYFGISGRIRWNQRSESAGLRNLIIKKDKTVIQTIPRMASGLLLAISLLSTLIGCASSSPKVADLLPKGQVTKLKGTVGAPRDFTHLLVFGDSLSDPGNLSRRTFSYFLPHSVFYKGRFSNDPVWADYVEKALDVKVENFAVGGARTFKGPFFEGLVVRSLPDQIESSRSVLDEFVPEETLVAIWIGPNNYLRGEFRYEDEEKRPIPSSLRKGVHDSINNIRDGIQTLRKRGYQRFLVGTMPELSGLNFDPHGGPHLSDQTFALATQWHNEELLKMQKSLGKGVKLFHAYEIDQETVKDPKAFGFSRLDAPCYNGSLTGKFYGEETFCSDPMGYKFWEFIHPNTRMQCIYAAQFLEDLSNISLLEDFSLSNAIDRCRKS